MYLLPALASLLTLTSASIISRQTTTTTTTQACNNHPSFCSKLYNSIVHLGAHDSPFVRDATTGFSTSGNQFYNSTIQLDAGVRLLSGQIHVSNNDLHLCHSSCDLLDAGLLSTWLMSLKVWLDQHPNDVITILLVNSDDSTAADIGAHFQTASITDYAYIPPSPGVVPSSWPTLNDLISAQKRLMIFIASLPSTDTTTTQHPYLLDEFSYMFENPFENTAFSSFTCSPDRPSSLKGNIPAALASNKLPLMNHFLYKEEGLFDIQTPAVDNITTTNNPSTSAIGQLGNALQSCTSSYSRPPTFVLVDFFDEGPAIDAVDAANGLSSSSPAVGRIAVPPRNHNAKEGEIKDRTFSGVEELTKQVAMGGEKPGLGAWVWAAGQWTGGGINLSGRGSVLG